MIMKLAHGEAFAPVQSRWTVLRACSFLLFITTEMSTYSVAEGSSALPKIVGRLPHVYASSHMHALGACVHDLSQAQSCRLLPYVPALLLDSTN